MVYCGILQDIVQAFTINTFIFLKVMLDTVQALTTYVRVLALEMLWDF